MTVDPVTSLSHLPRGPWTFDEDVTAVFDDMLRRSIPLHDTMRLLSFELGRHFVQPGSDVVDLGCSRGEALAPFLALDGTRGVGVEVAAPMIGAARERFAQEILEGRARIEELDLNAGYPPGVDASLTLAVLTLQFLAPERRAALLAAARRSTRDGGAMIVVEKVRGATDRFDELFTELYHDKKVQSGYSRESVERKRLALQGVLQPRTAEENEAALRDAGFGQVECVWRCLNFAGWLAIA